MKPLQGQIYLKYSNQVKTWKDTYFPTRLTYSWHLNLNFSKIRSVIDYSNVELLEIACNGFVDPMLE